MTAQLLSTSEGQTLVLTLSNPEFRNALGPEMYAAGVEALSVAESSPDVRSVVITGANGIFSAGGNLQRLQNNRQLPPEHQAQSIEGLHNWIEAIRTFPKPVIAAVDGPAAGAGFSLALACDFIVASENATLIEVFVNIGLVLDSGSSYFLPRLVGSAKAFELSTMGSRVKAAEALQLGLVNRVVPADELDAAVKGVTDYYANAPTKSIALMKRMLNKSFHSDLDTMLDYEAQCQDIAGATNDYREGVSAFLEKRPAEFKGN